MNFLSFLPTAVFAFAIPQSYAAEWSFAEQPGHRDVSSMGSRCCST
jgi:hypothetical protein